MASPHHMLLGKFFYHHPYINPIQDASINHVLPASALPRRGRKCQEDSTQSSVFKDNKLILTSSKIVNLSSDGGAEPRKAEKQGTSTGGRRRKRDLSPSDSVNDYQNGVSKKSGITLEKEILSSCDSVATIGGSNVSVQNLKKNNIRLMENVNVKRNINVEHSNHPRTKLRGPCSWKEISEKDEALIGQRIKFLSPVDKCFYPGTVDGYNTQNNTYKKRKVGKKASVDTSASEVTNANEDAVRLALYFRCYHYILLLYIDISSRIISLQYRCFFAAQENFIPCMFVFIDIYPWLCVSLFLFDYFVQVARRT
ncbi:uncharacterized protein [Malus domestica]|uniref:uncharacterized protein isoform X2 n=1 Tax=Malus domestica TaxID=3750 RepID=UPI00397627A2